MERPAARRLGDDDGRLHLHHGPIDLIIEAFGTAAEVGAAYAAAVRRFETVLDELCSELPLLRSAAGTRAEPPRGRIARRMVEAITPYSAGRFITPMAAVAGAVAEEILDAMAGAATLDKAYVNNGGDIALALAADAVFEIGIVARPDRASLVGSARIDGASPIRGIATSGWRGRSFSLGIADAVTILAATAALADAAATVVANSVDLSGHPAISRAPAASLQPDNDLGDRLVTTGVGPLLPHEIELALARGRDMAEALVARGHIGGAALFLEGHGALVGDVRIGGSDIPHAALPPQPESTRSFAHA